MKSEDLLRHIGSVKDEYIEEIMTESVRTARRRTDSRRMITSIAASLAVVILGASVIAMHGAPVERDNLSLTGTVHNMAMAENSIVMLDVNPSVLVEVNDRNVVVRVEGLNDDAQTVLDGLELAGKEYETAVSEIVTSMQENGYITELKNSILVSAEAATNDMAQQLVDISVDVITQIDETVDYGFSILSQIIDHTDSAAALAEKYGVSEGRVDMINKFLGEHEDYSFEMLIDNNVQLLNQLFEYVGLPQGIERIGQVAGVVPAECEKKLALHELSGQEILSFTSAISDFYDKLSDYYSAGDVAKRIGYEFSIVEQTTEDGQKLWAVLAESLTKSIGNHGAIINIGKGTADWLSQDDTGKMIEDLVGAIIKAA